MTTGGAGVLSQVLVRFGWRVVEKDICVCVDNSHSIGEHHKQLQTQQRRVRREQPLSSFVKIGNFGWTKKLNRLVDWIGTDEKQSNDFLCQIPTLLYATYCCAKRRKPTVLSHEFHEILPFDLANKFVPGFGVPRI